ncbi:hypothetical protein GRI58_11190 [Porphyrobacter algicida]|uniref:Uncharacterized protein n=1 Tax=Qipengyuania algicida TaxID=1836209 RepID=A0A845AIY9_9SPHN|nr:hypothetical protein [Qipengyuania algicida]MXP29387.1 hypothetical protein [Qipengyuania algicida]
MSDRDNVLQPTRPVLKGRSIYYGFLVYFPMRALGAWAAIALQALLVAGLLIFCSSVALRGLPAERRFWPYIGLAVLVFLSPLPFYVSMLMPDIYSGMLILSLATLIVFWARLSRRERVLLALACGIMASFHTTILLLTIVIGLLGGLLWLLGRISWQAAMMPIPIVLIAVLGNLAFNVSVERALRTQPMSPPFLSARLTEDGPGLAYLRETCPTKPNSWELCQHLANLPQPSDYFLWSDREGQGVFQVATAAQQKRMAREDKRFALAVLKYEPGTVIGTSVQGAIKMLVGFDLANFNYPGSRVDGLAIRYPASIAADIATTRAARNTMPTSFSVVATIVTSLGALLVVMWYLSRAAIRRDFSKDDIAIYCALVLVAILANDAICGALSTAHARYQMRLIWLLPFVGAVVLTMRKVESAKRTRATR